MIDTERSRSKLPPLTQEQLLEAVTLGVRHGICDLGSSWGRFDIPHELFYEAIRHGARDAIWQLATHAAQTPCADFYAAVSDGVEAALRDLKPEDLPRKD
jgi:hypothetical protein